MKDTTNVFEQIATQIVGRDAEFRSPFGKKKILYADWTASGRLYEPIEERISYLFGAYMGNTHTETSITGTIMTEAYKEARRIIKSHVGATEKDVLLFSGTGMTGAVCKLQRILGLCMHEKYKSLVHLPNRERPVVFISHMEHHSNHTSWLETICEVVVIPPSENGDICLHSLEQQLQKYHDRKMKIGSFTACSNVTGIQTRYHDIAKLMHQYNGFCFVDFSASAPYVPINMHPANAEEKLDAIFFSPHKFLGGPGACGVVVFSSDLYKNETPDQPGGGTVEWTNPWGEKAYVKDIESREDGGTPGILQAFRAALAIKLKEQMNPIRIKQREKELVHLLFHHLEQIDSLVILESTRRDRLPIVSVFTPNCHYNLMVKLLNDVFGIQVRGGCACAGTYGHYLFSITKEMSHFISTEIDHGNKRPKPGWVRISLHPTMTNEEVVYISNAIKYILYHLEDLEADYLYCNQTNEYIHRSEEKINTTSWFELTTM